MALLLAAFATFLSVYTISAETEILNLILISSGGGQYNSSGVEPAVDLAVQIINDNQVIPGYKLNVASRGDSNCDRSVALDEFLKSVSVGSEKIALFGSGCSIATEAVAEISSFWNITHFSYASSVDSLSNRNRFPNFWRTHPRESNLATSIISLMEEYNWKEIKIITQEETLFIESTSTLTKMLQDRNLTVLNGTNSFATSIDVSNDTRYFLPEARIYFLNMYSIHARRIMCSAALNVGATPDMFVPEYVWITLGWYRDRWWSEEISQDNLPNCTDSILEPLLSRTIGIQEANSPPDRNAPTDVNLTAAEFKEKYTTRLGDQYYFEPTATYAYDAIWAFSLALNSSLSYFVDQDISIGNFSYNTGEKITDIIHMELSDPTFGFDGVSGYVEFDESGTRRQSKPHIFKYRNVTNDDGVSKIEPVLVAVINETTLLYVNNESDETVWLEYVPGDGTPISVVLPIKIPLLIVYYALATIGIIFAFICFLFNLIFRNRKIIKLISPNLNYLIIAGGIMCYSTAYFFAFSSTNPNLITFSCHIRSWLLFLGYFLCFGTIVVKMWRVYYIFHNPAIKIKKSRIPKDWHLFLIIMLMCFVVVFSLLFVVLFANYGAIEVEDKETRASRNDTTMIIIRYTNYVCGGPRDLIWIIYSYGCVVLTQIVAVVLAFRTRKVTIKALNDSKYLTIIIYLSTVIIVAMLISAVLLDEYLNVDAAIFGGLMLLFTTVVLALTFIPKMIILYKDPKGEKIFDRGQSQGTINATNLGDTKIEGSNDLEKHCIELESRLGKYENVVPFRSLTRTSSIRKYSTTSYVSTTAIHSVNPTCSLPVTMIKSDEGKITHATSGYLSEGSSTNDKTGEDSTDGPAK